ncbi:MAG: N-acetylmuramoyl-L-alanine amidase [Ruminococcus sp.]|nr:N-acetylmuramoyl-L-alanine amidase [Ruminococcus sp.]
MLRLDNKKRNIIIISVAAVFVVAVAVILAVFAPKSPSVLTQGEAVADMREGELQKAKKMSNTVVLAQGSDITLPNDDSSKKIRQNAEKTAKALGNSIFDSVMLKTDYLTQKSKQGEHDYRRPDAEKIEPITSFLSLLSKNKLKSYLQIDISHSADFIAKICENKAVSGVVLVGAGKMTADEINSAVKAVKAALPKAEISVLLSAEKAELEKLKHVSNLILTVPAKQEASDLFANLESLAKKISAKITLNFPISKCSEDRLHASWLLEQMMKADGFDFVSARLFDSYSAVKNDFDSCFTAAETYINSGVNPSAVFANLIIEDYNGELVQTDKYKLNVNIRGSYLYPVTLGKQKIMLSESGKAEVELALKTGENTFNFKQNGNEAEYRANVTFSGNLISSVEPNEALYAHEKQAVSLKIAAVQGADVTVRLGTEKFTAKQGKYIGNGYCSYTAKIKMPSSKIEIESLGNVSISAVFGERTEAFDTLKIVYSPKQSSNVTNTQPEETSAGQVTLPANNFNGYTTEPSKVASPTANASAPANISSFTTVAAVTDMIYPSVSAYTGNQMCVVTTPYADTWPLGNDDKYVPYYTTLTQGTMDYVVGESEVYDSEEQETRTFYTLASGRRIQKKSVSLVEPNQLEDNELSVLSSQNVNGALKITLSTKWKVPYSFNFSPQEYYSAKGRLYNVRSFTASYIQFTFYNTVAANGQVDVSGSDVAASASWSVDNSQKTAVLTLPLRTQGGYYGYVLEYDVNGNIVLTIKNKPKSISGSVVVLDPGHGGKDPGALGYSNWLEEADVNFSAAVMVKNELERRGATVYMTRYDDSYVSLEERKAFARTVKPDVFVSVHSNASEDTSAYGTAVYYYRPMSQPLSNAIYTQLVSAFKNYLYPNDASRQAGVELGSNYNPFSVARLEECPSVLIEMGFVTNELECRKLADDACRQQIANAIANGIEAYLNG